MRIPPETYLGKTFGKLTAKSCHYGFEGKTKRMLFVFDCACGGQTICRIHSVISGARKSCGCMKAKGRPFSDYTSKQFGKLLVLSYQGHDGKDHQWLTRCQCGKERIQSADTIRNRASCGCVRIRHGHAINKTPTYSSWQNIIARCTNQSSPAFAHYQAKGIRICDRWLSSFDSFLSDMGERPSTKHTIDRIDNSGNYEPGNCRWATKVEQANNRDTNILFEYRGQKYTLANLARVSGISKELLRCRLVRNKGHKQWTVEEAITTPRVRGRRFDRLK